MSKNGHVLLFDTAVYVSVVCIYFPGGHGLSSGGCNQLVSYAYIKQDDWLEEIVLIMPCTHFHYLHILRFGNTIHGAKMHRDRIWNQNPP